MLYDLGNQLKNISIISPVLLLGEAAKLVRDHYNRNEIHINISKETPFKKTINVFEVCSFSSDTSFLDTDVPIVILAEDTANLENILPKVKYIIKYSTKFSSKLVCAKEALELWKEDDSNISFDKYCAINSPELYYLKNKYNMNKYVELFSGEL